MYMEEKWYKFRLVFQWALILFVTFYIADNTFTFLYLIFDIVDWSAMKTRPIELCYMGTVSLLKIISFPILYYFLKTSKIKEIRDFMSEIRTSNQIKIEVLLFTMFFPSLVLMTAHSLSCMIIGLEPAFTLALFLYVCTLTFCLSTWCFLLLNVIWLYVDWKAGKDTIFNRFIKYLYKLYIDWKNGKRKIFNRLIKYLYRLYIIWKNKRNVKSQKNIEVKNFQTTNTSTFIYFYLTVLTYHIYEIFNMFTMRKVLNNLEVELPKMSKWKIFLFIFLSLLLVPSFYTFAKLNIALWTLYVETVGLLLYSVGFLYVLEGLRRLESFAQKEYNREIRYSRIYAFMFGSLYLNYAINNFADRINGRNAYQGLSIIEKIKLFLKDNGEAIIYCIILSVIVIHILLPYVPKWG